MRRLIHSVAFIDPSGGSVVDHGYLVIQDDRIESMGSGDHTESQDRFDEVIDGTGKLLLPGFINTHGHAAMSLLRGFADDLPLQSWLSDLIWPAEALLTAEDIHLGTQLAMLEMIETGTTTFTDMYFHMDRVAEAVIDAGMRAVLGRGMVAIGSGGEMALEESQSFIRTYHMANRGLIKTTLAPHAPYTCPADFLAKVIPVAEKLDVPMQIHVSETRQEVDDSIRQYGMTPVKWLAAQGVFNVPAIAAHCVHVDEDDIHTLKEQHVHVAHNPGSNLKLASGIAPLAQMLQAGIQVGVGTDGAASNNKLDMYDELRLVALLHKGNQFDATAINALTALRLVTEAGAKVLHLEQGLGTLTPGAPADLQLLDITGPRYFPRHNLLAHVVYSSHGGDVSDVFVGGKPLYRNRAFTTLDQEKILFLAAKTGEKFWPVRTNYLSQKSR